MDGDLEILDLFKFLDGLQFGSVFGDIGKPSLQLDAISKHD